MTLGPGSAWILLVDLGSLSVVSWQAQNTFGGSEPADPGSRFPFGSPRGSLLGDGMWNMFPSTLTHFLMSPL